MNVVPNRVSSLGKVLTSDEPNPYTVEFYDEIPNFELSLDEFEVFALARLKVCQNSVSSSSIVHIFPITF
jgi:hypothetical protein